MEKLTDLEKKEIIKEYVSALIKDGAVNNANNPNISWGEVGMSDRTREARAKLATIHFGDRSLHPLDSWVNAERILTLYSILENRDLFVSRSIRGEHEFIFGHQKQPNESLEVFNIRAKGSFSSIKMITASYIDGKLFDIKSDAPDFEGKIKVHTHNPLMQEFLSQMAEKSRNVEL